MIRGEHMPLIYTGSSALESVRKIDESNVGFVLIIDQENHLFGILTDGDVRRCVRQQVNFGEKTVDDLMTRSPKTIDPNTSLAETIEVLQRDEITTLMIVDDEGRLEGYVHLHDILGRGGTVKISPP